MPSARFSSIFSVLAVMLSTRAAPAVPSAAEAAPRHFELERTSTQFLMGESAVVLGAYASAWWLTGGPKTSCRWCASNSFDASIRRSLRADNPRPPALISHALSVGAIPVLGLTSLIAPAGLDGHWHRGLEDTWIVVNTFGVTTAIGEAIKHLVARERPAFHYEAETATEFATYPSERNKSFFSLDTAWAFAIASSSTTLAFLRGYSTAPYVGIGGGLMAIGAGTLRIVGDAHWATDVLTGAAVGTVVGIGMPLILHGRRERAASEVSPAVSVAPLTQGSGISFAMQF